MIGIEDLVRTKRANDCCPFSSRRAIIGLKLPPPYCAPTSTSKPDTDTPQGLAVFFPKPSNIEGKSGHDSAASGLVRILTCFNKR